MGNNTMPNPSRTRANHKYIAKINGRYFYSQAELDAYRAGTADATRKRVVKSDRLPTGSGNIHDMAVNAQRRKAQQNQKLANAKKVWQSEHDKQVEAQRQHSAKQKAAHQQFLDRKKQYNQQNARAVEAQRKISAAKQKVTGKGPATKPTAHRIKTGSADLHSIAVERNRKKAAEKQAAYNRWKSQRDQRRKAHDAQVEANRQASAKKQAIRQSANKKLAENQARDRKRQAQKEAYQRAINNKKNQFKSVGKQWQKFGNDTARQGNQAKREINRAVNNIQKRANSTASGARKTVAKKQSDFNRVGNQWKQFGQNTANDINKARKNASKAYSNFKSMFKRNKRGARRR